MDDLEVVGTLQGLLFRVKVVTGWRLPELPEERRVLYSELALHLQQKWATFNQEEVMYAIRNFSGTDWGKDVNVQLLDEALQHYADLRKELSKMEEQKSFKPVALLQGAVDWKEVIEMDYQHFLAGQLNIHLMPHQAYDECVSIGYIAEDTYEDFLEDSRNKLIATETGKREIALLNRNTKEAAECAARIDGYKSGNEMVGFFAKRLCVKFFFGQAKKMNVKNLFIKEPA
jgi:hypothetical protein